MKPVRRLAEWKTRARCRAGDAATHLSWIARAGWLLFLRDFRYRFRLTYLGSFWLIARLPLTSLPLIFVGQHFNMGGEQPQVPYPLYMMTSLLLWQVFWDGVTMPQWLARRVRRVFPDTAFPREALLAGAAGYAAVTILMQFIAMACAFVAYQYVPPPTMILGILAVPLLFAGGLAIGMPLVPFSFVYLDIRYALPFLSPILMWTAPIIYVMPASGSLAVINRLNPITYLIGVPRGWMLGHGDLPLWAFAVAWIALIGLLALGLRAFRRGMSLAVEFLSR